MRGRPVLIACTLALLGAPAGATAAVEPGIPQPDGTHPPLTLTEAKAMTSRLSELTFATPYVNEPTHVRVLLPVSYESQPRRLYPVLYLLHGCCDDWKSWSDKGAAEELSNDYDVIVVMPDAGTDGWYSDWYNDGAWGNPRWESYHIGQLLPWIDGHYRTTGVRSGRAVMGLSMGGFGTMSYAARHPDLFAFAASFSGADDTSAGAQLGSAAAGATAAPTSPAGRRTIPARSP